MPLRSHVGRYLSLFFVFFPFAICHIWDRALKSLPILFLCKPRRFMAEPNNVQYITAMYGNRKTRCSIQIRCLSSGRTSHPPASSSATPSPDNNNNPPSAPSATSHVNRHRASRIGSESNVRPGDPLRCRPTRSRSNLIYEHSVTTLMDDAARKLTPDSFGFVALRDDRPARASRVGNLSRALDEPLRSPGIDLDPGCQGIE